MGSDKGRALVIGGAGLIGSHLVDLLIEKGYDVTLLDNLEEQTHRQGRPPWLNREARFIEGDVRNESHLSEALEGARFVFHQAAFVGFTENISKYIDTNAIGTARIFELLESGRFKVEKVVVASSQAVYGEGAYECADDGPQYPLERSFEQMKKRRWESLCPRCGKDLLPALTSEEKRRDGYTAYALSKEFEERIALSCGKKLGIPVVALRYAVTYGPRQSVFNPYTGVASIFSTRLLNHLPPLIYEDGRQTRDFIFVGDVARANLFVMENELANHQVFNVSTGKPTAVTELARTLASIYGESIEPEISAQFRWGDVRHILLDPGRLTRLGFTASTSVKDGLTRFAEWIKTQGKIEEYFTRAHDQLKRKRVVYG